MLVKMKNVLFICSRNQWRSPTAEQIWRNHPELNVRSAGTSSNARKKVSGNDVQWADIIMVMEKKHKSRLTAEFHHLLNHKIIHVLEIPDDYRYMDPELIAEFQACVPTLLEIE